MKYTTKAAEKSTVKITLKFDGEEWKAAIQNAYLKTRGRFAINGFRKGKAPKNVIESVYGKGGTKYTKRCAFCLEPEFYPNAVNVQSFEKPLLKKGETANYYINYFITEV